MLQRTAPLLAGGGGSAYRLGWSQKRNESATKKPPLAKASKYGRYYTKPHKAGRPFFTSLYRQRDTMTYHKVAAPDYVQLGFKEHLNLPQERAEVVYEPSGFVPRKARHLYEAWKRDNVEEVAQYAGKYVIGTWELQVDAEEGDWQGTGGIVRVFERDEEPAIRSYIKDLETESTATTTQWLDYIPPGFGTKAEWVRPMEAPRVVESGTKPKRQNGEQRWWNSTKFDDVDQLKEWLDFSIKPCRKHAPQSTPISKKLPAGEVRAELPNPPLPYPAVPKWMTFNSELPYGTEQFSGWYNTNARLEYKFFSPCNNIRQVMPLGFVRKNTVSDVSQVSLRLYDWVSRMKKNDSTLPHFVSPDGREAHVVPWSKMRALALTSERYGQQAHVGSLSSRRFRLHHRSYTHMFNLHSYVGRDRQGRRAVK
eukprot:TRINITY_DN30772_c0_g1_i1.p1 TRINITY_DN30772_c0_g1~~TRINITY_DN30772_c0_g1_i1.p1  ORF type:complete len:423 (+),score=107.86 TRINITY_DN30772_c0_g1_i1:105-1373(+)